MLKNVALAALLLATLAAANARAGGGGRNLEHYPKDIAAGDLKAAMKDLKVQLGTTCAFCHKTEPTRDWAATTEKKKVALGMLDLTTRIGKELLTDEYFPEQEPPRATCFLCHKGHEKVETAPAKPEDEKRFNDSIARGKHKRTADAMKKMVEKLNKDFFTWKDAPKATCWMCHRGRGELKTRPPKPGEDGDEEKGVDWGAGPSAGGEKKAEPAPEKKPETKPEAKPEKKPAPKEDEPI